MTTVIYHLRALEADFIAAWDHYFADIPEVKPSQGDIFEFPADAIISPANCFGFMDGGIDRLYSEYLGWHVQDRLRTHLKDQYDGELPIGMAVLVETDHPEIPYLISAPTLRAPVNVSETVNAFLAFRAAIRVINRKNVQEPGTIKSVLCPGLGTGTGEMPVERCAKQMHAAYVNVMYEGDPVPASVNDALLQHYRLLRTDD